MRFAKTYRLLLIVALAMMTQVVQAESRETRVVQRHEFRIGWGDPLFESVAFRPTMHRDYTYITPGFDYTERQNYQYLGHFMLEFQFRPNTWFGAGLQVDYSQFSWDALTYQGGSNTPVLDKRELCYNVLVMPTIRFTYLHREWVDLYSGLGVGLALNGGTEMNDNGYKVEAGLAANIAVLGMTVGKKHFFGGVELGGVVALQNVDRVYLLDSRIFTASIGVRW